MALATVATVFSIGSSVLGAVQSFSAAKESEKQAQRAIDNAHKVARAQIEAGNAAQAQADAQAKAERASTALEKKQEGKRQRLAIGKQRAAAGASGVLLEGSPLEALEFQAQEDALSLLVLEHNGELRATELLNQGIAIANQQNISAQGTFNQGISQANQLTQQAAAQKSEAIGSLGNAAGTFLGSDAFGGSKTPVGSFDDANGREIFVFDGGQTTTLPGVKPVRVS